MEPSVRSCTGRLLPGLHQALRHTRKVVDEFVIGRVTMVGFELELHASPLWLTRILRRCTA